MADLSFDVTKDLRVLVRGGVATYSGDGWTDKDVREEVARAISGLERDIMRLREWLRLAMKEDA